MNCEFHDKKTNKCRIDGGNCRAASFCRLLGVEKPSDGVPFVEGMFRRVTKKQASRLTQTINTILQKPALR